MRYLNVIGAEKRGRLGENPRKFLLNYVRLWTSCVNVALGKQNEIVLGQNVQSLDDSEMRDFVHVSDLVDAHIVVLSLFKKNTPFQVSNIGTGKPTSTVEFVRTCQNVSNTSIPFRITKSKQGNPPILYSDMGNLQRDGHWRPKYVNIRDSLKTAWDYVKNVQIVNKTQFSFSPLS